MAENEPRTVSIDPKVQVNELQAQFGFLTNRNLILAQALEDALGHLATAEETIKQRDAEIARLDALRAPQVLDGEP